MGSVDRGGGRGKKRVKPSERGPSKTESVENQARKVEKKTNDVIHVFCNQNETSFLIDTGSSVSLLPKEVFNPEGTSKTVLVAANGTPIEVFGTKDLFVDLGLGRIFLHSFIVADVQECILGIDFLKNNSLLLDASKNALLLPQTLTYVDSESLMPKPLMPPDIRVDPESPFAKVDEIYGNDISFLNEDLKTLLRRHPESLNKQV